MNNRTISLMEKSDIAESARVLSIAMLDNPMHLAVYQNSDESTRIEIEDDFKNLMSKKPGIVFIAKEQQKIIGVMRMNSCTGKDTPYEEVESEDENNIDWRRKVWLNEWDRQDPKVQHWHLGPIGVLPTYQGIGVGSDLLKRFCAEADACKADAFLETDRDINVKFYKKFGFKTVSESMVLGVRTDFMLRVSKR
jgi:ribosomal protein S18 acetylase RimI-like enzyme